VLLFTDGGSSPASERVARALRESGYTLSVLAVGTNDGAPIPRERGGFVTDQSGQIAVPRLEAASLGSLARAGGGQFSVLTTDDRDLDLLLSGEVGLRSAADESLATDQFREEGPWLLLLLLPLAAIAFRRGWVLLVVIAVLPVSEPVHASAWDDLWQTKDQQAQQKLEEGAAAEAAELFEDPEWQGVAQYRSQDYANSAARFADREDLRSRYNLGNALARQGAFEPAIEAYEQALAIDPDDADAEYNRDLVKQLLEQQQQQQGDQQQPNESGGGQESESDDESAQQSDGDASPGDSESQEDDGSGRAEDMTEEDLQALADELERAAQEAQQDGEASEQQMTAAELEELRREQEQQQAMEQWLRRIPNDPGALLRNKFRYQYQKTGKDQDGNNTWPDDEVQPW